MKAGYFHGLAAMDHPAFAGPLPGLEKVDGRPKGDHETRLRSSLDNPRTLSPEGERGEYGNPRIPFGDSQNFCMPCVHPKMWDMFSPRGGGPPAGGAFTSRSLAPSNARRTETGERIARPRIRRKLVPPRFRFWKVLRSRSASSMRPKRR
jgi:hypothetical protein